MELNLDLPAGAVALAGPVADYPLPPAEALYVEAAKPKRRRQFASGRHYARAALRRLGADGGPILRRGRSPQWPNGFIGSISHTETLATALVARVEVAQGVGIDIELVDRLKAKLHTKVLTASERQCPWQDGREGVVVFSAKEAAYKAVNPTTGVYVGFLEVEVSLDWRHSAFRLRYLGPHEPNRVLNEGAGIFRFIDDQVVTAFLLG